MDTPPALAFDVYGTLVDPIGISRQLEEHLDDERAALVAEVWRRKQLEITFRLTAMQAYRDFEWCTRRGLDYALAHAGCELDDRAKDALLERYAQLEVFPDVTAGLDALREAGLDMVVLSNGSPTMLDELLSSTGLGTYFRRCLSADEVRTYKPSPAVYLHAARHLARPPGEVMLVSSNPFDVIGAEAAGLRAAWVDRNHGQFEADGRPPELVVDSLTSLASALTSTG